VFALWSCILIHCVWCGIGNLKENEKLVWVLVNGSIHETAAMLCCCDHTHDTVVSSIHTCRLKFFVLAILEIIYQPCVVSGTI
jgi:hypothetical protein